MAVSDYCNTGNDLLWKKHMGDQEKPKNWDIGYYPWYINPKKVALVNTQSTSPHDLPSKSCGEDSYRLFQQ
jgi:hypothetical protein